MRQSPGTPGSVMTAAVLLFIYGGLLLLCGVCGGVSTAVVPNQGPEQQRMKAMLDADAPGHQIVGYASIGMNLVLALVIIGAGVGVLRWSNIARFVAYAAIVLELAVTCGTSIFQIAFVMPVTNRFIAQAIQAQQQKGAPPPPFDIGALMAGTGIVTVIVIIIIKLGFLLPVAFCLNAPGARAAFSGKLDAPPDDDRPRGSDDDDDYDRPRSKPKFPGDTGIADHG